MVEIFLRKLLLLTAMVLRGDYRTALPASFPDLDRQHAQERRNARLTPDINAHRQNNEQQVLRAPKGLPVKQQPAGPTATREEVQTQGARIKGHVDANRSEFDTKSELIRAEDGTLSSTHSLLKQSSKQVAKDAGASVDNVKDAVKDLLKK